MRLDYIWGANTIKYTQKVLWYTKTIKFIVKRLKVVAKYCLNWILLSMATSIVVLDAQI